jgi:hypothetical protein
MPLPKPSLDNRVFDQLVSEGRAQLPRLAPHWTDHNTSDPGITLLELGAWLAEQNIYRFDRLSVQAERAFVRLAGVEPKPAGVAYTVTALENDNAGMWLAPRLQLGSADAALFESSEAVFASPAKLVSVMTGGTQLLDVTTANSGLSGFAAFGPRPRARHALYLGFDRPLDAPGATLSLHVWTPNWQQDDAVRVALQDEASMVSPTHCPAPPDWRQHYRVKTVWEYHAGSDVWLPIPSVEDETRSLSLTGFVRFAAPEGHQAGGPGNAFYIRCRIQRGRFECPPKLLHVALNAVRCEHALSQAERSVGRSRGHAGAVFALGQAPVVAGSLRLRLDDGNHPPTDWAAVSDWDRAGPNDRVVLLDFERGTVTGGNGLRGALLPAEHELRASWQVGAGPQGNIPAGSLSWLPATPANLALLPPLGQPLRVRQPLPASGGSAAETLAQAQARAYETVAEVDKAVTLEDIERLALATPGVPVARVHAVAGLDPLLPCYPAVGVVSVIVIPSCPRPAPMPSRALLNAVERHLAPRRLITSEIHAIAPRYRRVGVQATLHLGCNADPSTVLAAATQRIAAFFDPLSGGPDGTGWPLGRTVYRSEIMALLVGVTGIERLTDLSLLTACNGCGGSPPGHCDNVALCAHELVLPGRHQWSLAADTPRSFTRSLAHEC